MIMFITLEPLGIFYQILDTNTFLHIFAIEQPYIARAYFRDNCVCMS